MKIGFVSTMIGAAWGGSEELWAAAALEARRRQINVVASVYRSKTRSPKRDALAAAGIKMLERALRRTKIANQIDRFIPPLKSFTASQPNVICISQGFPYDFTTRQRAEELKRLTDGWQIPYVLVCQFNSDDLTIPPGRLAASQELYSRAKKTLFVAEHNRIVTERQLGLKLADASVVRNPVNLSDTREVPWPSASETLPMATVCRLDAGTKGLDLLFAVLSGEPWKNRNWRLSLFGTGPDEQKLRDTAIAGRIEKRIHFRGQTSDIRQVWAENEILLLPSRAEGTPLALVEAMLCGRPAVVTAVGGNKEWIEDNQNGFVAEQPSRQALAEAMERMWKQRESFHTFGQRARHSALERYDPAPGQTLLNILLHVAQKQP